MSDATQPRPPSLILSYQHTLTFPFAMFLLFVVCYILLLFCFSLLFFVPSSSSSSSSSSSQAGRKEQRHHCGRIQKTPQLLLLLLAPPLLPARTPTWPQSEPEPGPSPGPGHAACRSVWGHQARGRADWHQQPRPTRYLTPPNQPKQTKLSA